MKKVSVGVFAILTAFVVVKSGRAEIASQGYVDSQVYHLASKEYVDTNFQNLNKKVTSDNYEQLVEDDEIPMTDLYTSLEYVDSQNALDEKVSNKIGDLMSRPANAMTGKKNGAFEEWFSSNIQESSTKYLSASATRTLIDEALWELSYNTEKYTGPNLAVERPATFITDISQKAGLIAPVKSSFLESLDGEGVDLWNAPTGIAVIEYVDQKISDIGGDIGNAYQLKSEKLKSTDSDTRITEDNKDDLYPSVAKTTDIVKNAILDLDSGPIGEEGSFIESVRQQDGKLGAAAVPFETVINDSTKDSVVAPQTKAVVEYAEAKANKVEKVEEYEDLTTGNKETFYPSVALAEYIAQEAAKAAIAQLQAIVNVPAKCAQAEKYCVLTTNGTDFVWEVIERSTSADHPEPSVSTDANAERMKVYPITNQ